MASTGQGRGGEVAGGEARHDDVLCGALLEQRGGNAGREGGGERGIERESRRRGVARTGRGKAGRVGACGEVACGGARQHDWLTQWLCGASYRVVGEAGREGGDGE
jgi:hypothetical protein